MAGKGRRLYQETHKDVKFWLPKEQAERLGQALKRRGLSQSQWLQAKIDQELSERLPESQGGVRKTIPLGFIRMAREILAREADVYFRLAENTAPRMEKARLLERADILQNYVSWLSTALEEYRFREHILQTGQKSPRQRRKSSSKPAVDKTSNTYDAPTG